MKPLRRISLLPMLAIGLLSSSPANAVILASDPERLGNNLASPADWPAAVMVHSHQVRCSGAVIGKRAIITIPACVDSQSKAEQASTRLVVGNNEYPLRCTLLPPGETGSSAPVALCATSQPLPAFAYFRLRERPTLDAAQRYKLLGYGCRYPLGVDRSYGTLTVGTSSLSRDEDVPDIGILSSDILCAGDGGGPMVSASVDNGRKPTELLGIALPWSDAGKSQIFLTSSEKFVSAVQHWAETNGLSLCLDDGKPGNCGVAPDFQDIGLESAPLGRPRMERSRTAASMEQAQNLSSISLLVVSNAAGETVRDAVERKCGTQPEAYYKFLSEVHAQGLLIGEDLRSGASRLTAGEVQALELSTAGRINIPSCLPTPLQVQPYRIKFGDNPYKLYKRFGESAQGADPGQWRDFKRPGNAPAPAGPDWASPYFLDVYRSLNPDADAVLKVGQTINLPVVTALGNRTSAVKMDVPAAAAAAPALLEPDFQHIGLNDKLANFAVPSGGPEAQAGGVSCNSTLPETEFPYDVAELLDVLARNREHRRRHGLSQARRPPTVLIADTGLFGPGRLPAFPSDVLRRPSHGTFSEYAGLIVPPEEAFYKKASHGTEVASLALGGPLFARMRASFAPPLLNLRITRLFDVKLDFVRDRSTGEQTTGQRIAFDEAHMETLRQQLAASDDIVNLSYASTQSFRGFSETDVEEANKNILFVVAAGNGGAELGEDGEGSAIYPALLGGSERKNLITVAATTHTGELWSRSNYSAHYVDLAAPGCDVPAFSYDQAGEEFFVRKMNGTSMAAPLVSFASALIRAELADASAAQLKRRILVSADMNPHLSPGQVIHRRQLNIARAVSVFDDVLTRQSDGKMFWGKAAFLKPDGVTAYKKAEIIEFCEGVRLRSGSLFKIVPGFKDWSDGVPLQGTLFYHGRKESKKLVYKKKLCPRINPKLRVRFVSDYPVSKLLTVEIGKVEDLTMGF